MGSQVRFNRGEHIVMGGTGDDILTDVFGDDQIRGADGNDVISNSSGLDLLFGGDGKDAIFGGEGADLLQGDNGVPFLVSTVIGHDVLIAGNDDDDDDDESGDDIQFRTPGINRSEGMLGIDWVTYARSTELVDADLRNTALLPPTLANLRDRFDLVEGLSGFNGNDKLTGSNLLAADLVGHELNSDGVARIAGLAAVLAGAKGYNAGATGLATAFSGGDIILGGGGNDTVTGGAGDDVLDGDAWLNARIEATSNSGVVTSHTSLATLRASLLNGTINPNNLVIVREILKAATPGAADVAVFSGARANYTIAVRADSSRVVTDNVGTDGVDLLRNFEIIRFADQDVAIAPNRSATGAPLISDTTPTEGGALTVNTAAIADADGLGAFSFQWQTSTNSGATWANIAGATTAAFTPVQQQVNTQLRVAVRFTDGQGFAGRKCWPRPPTLSVT